MLEGARTSPRPSDDPVTVSADGALLERAEELARVETALAQARSGRGAFVVVEGRAGIGKTALLGAARTAAASEGMRVLRARGAELERDFAFGVVRQLFEPALADASDSERADLLQGAAGVAAGLLGLPGAARATTADASSDADPSFAILHGLYWLCANLSSASPLCLVVDDAHYADAASLRYLAFLLTRLEDIEVALVLATRPCDEGTEGDVIATVKSDPSADAIRLRPLTGPAVAELVESSLGGPADASFVDACLRATRGTPFLLRVLVNALAEGRIAPTAENSSHVERIGARPIGRSVSLRLRRLPSHAGRLARALAVLGQGDVHEVARLAGLAESQAAEAVELLLTAGIVEFGPPLAFIHPIVHGGIYAELTSAGRAQGHRRAAQILAGQPGARESVPKHLLSSEPAGDEWVVERLVEAARAAARNGAPESTAAFLRRALVEPVPPQEEPRLLIELGMAEASAGLDGWHEHLQRAVDTAPDAAEAAVAARALSRALNRSQRFEDAIEVLDRASASLGSGHPELTLRLEAAAVVAGMNHPSTAASIAVRRDALRERADKDPHASAELLSVAALASVLMNEPAQSGGDLATRALLAADGSADRSAALFARTTLSLLWVERYAQLRPVLDASIAQARATSDSGHLAISLANRGWLALRRGDLSAAEGDARTAVEATRLPAPPLYRLLNGAVLVKALTDQGRLDAADRALALFDSCIEGGSLTADVLRLARGRLRVEQGRVAEGLEDFLAVGAGLTQATVTCPGFLPWRSEAALAHLALGDRESAARLAGEELELARAFGAPRALGVAKRAAGVVAGGDGGEALLREAVDDLERGDARVDRARALADLGAMLRRRNRRTQAREFLREALDVAHRAGAAPLADYAETELRATGARPRRAVLTGLDSLTASERRVAELAGDGLTNREIAQSLFVTARTVEGHLTSVFRKLELASRDQLAAALGLAEREHVRLDA